MTTDGAWEVLVASAHALARDDDLGSALPTMLGLVRPDGSDDHRIAVDLVEDSFPTWSPDGRFLIWARHGELVVARPDGSGMVEIGPGNLPSWIRGAGPSRAARPGSRASP